MINFDTEGILLKSFNFFEQEIKKHTTRLVPSHRQKQKDALRKRLERNKVKDMSVDVTRTGRCNGQQSPVDSLSPEASDRMSLDGSSTEENSLRTTTTKYDSEKDNAPQNNDYKIFTSAAFSPKVPCKKRAERYRLDCGEDAFFVCHTFPQRGDNDGTERSSCKLPSRVCSFGVADGVGGYALRGIDPSLMAWEVMRLSKKYIERDHETSCQEAMTLAYDEIIKNELVPCGGTTALVLCIDKQYSEEEKSFELYLTAANLGDSSFMVIRKGKIIHRSFEQTHFFNCPLQLTMPRIETNPMQDDPSKAIVLDSFELQRGDVIISSTDGLTDNVFDEDIAEIVHDISRDATEEDFSAQIAREILLKAYKNSRSKSTDTPFSKYAVEYGHVYNGGKRDDITLIVALIA